MRLYQVPGRARRKEAFARGVGNGDFVGDFGGVRGVVGEHGGVELGGGVGGRAVGGGGDERGAVGIGVGFGEGISGAEDLVFGCDLFEFAFQPLVVRG